LAIKDGDIGTVELRELKALVADQQERLNALEANQEAPEGDTKERRSTRRQLLKLAGATLMGAAGGAALKAIPASANNGDPMTVGTVSGQNLSNPTGISLTGAGAPGRVFHVYTAFASATYQNAIVGWGQTGGDGVIGYGGKTSGSGVYGYNYSGSNLAIGAFGATFNYGYAGLTGAGTGVVGYSSGGDGIHAHTTAQSRRALYAYTSATGSVGVAAYSKFGDGIRAGSNNNTGVFAYSGTYSAFLGISFSKSYAALGVGAPAGAPDIKLGGSGRFVQTANIAGGVGAPNYTPGGGTGYHGHGYFEIVRADDGAIWTSRGTGTLKAAWKRVNAVRVDSSDGAGTPFKPKRVIDTRIGGGAKKAAGTMNPVVVAGVGAGTSNIPADAVAVIGNLTAVNYTGSGYLAIMPAGVAFNPLADPSSVNFIVGQAAIANGFVVGLGTGANAGKVQVYVSGHASHFIIDVTGYLQ
jgi:hypothetical protein